MSYEERMALVRKESVEIAQELLGGSLGIIEGCRKLAKLGSSWTAHEEEEDWHGTRDPDFDVFKNLDYETIHLPLGDVRRHWGSDALARKDIEIAECEAAHKDEVLAACRRIIEKFSSGPSV
jgi:hypothetical protein